ncbi:Lsr2 family protein [Aeromicrobium sp. UC242_57]|uniref:Lsr2 family protein n=1 Tax=Aeromicrobium sp. UC242_57 TaxID=3374624 RepID=UPI00379D2D94
MASKTITLYVDDLDGTEIEEGHGGPVSFALDGQDYSVDLTDENAAALRDVLRPYVEVATKVARKTAGTRAKKTDSGPSPAELYVPGLPTTGSRCPRAVASLPACAPRGSQVARRASRSPQVRTVLDMLPWT